MKLTAHNLTNGTSTISFVVWSKKGAGMVNVYSPGDAGGDMKSTADARKYWLLMIEKYGYKQAESTVVEPC